jgi:hypothetical protein
LITAFANRATDAPDSSADQMFREFSANVSSSKANVLISSEWILRRKGNGGAREFVHYLLGMLDEDSWEVEILFGCRDHFERAASAYSQCIKGAKSDEQRGPDQFLHDRIQTLLYSHITQKIRRTGFKVTALNYHPSSGWSKRFLTYVGFIEGQIPEPEIKNSSLSTKALIAKLAANRMLRQKHERQMFWDALTKMPGYYASAQFIFGAGAAAEAERSFAADRQYLRDEFGIALPEPYLENRESMFFVDARDLDDIAIVARQLGEVSGTLIASAAQYLKA